MSRLDKPTDKQRNILSALRQRPETIRTVAGNVSMTIDQVQASMRRMEDNEWVRRIDTNFPARWELTGRGRDLIV